MDEQLKKRMVGAAVLAALAVIFVPMLLESPAPQKEPTLVKIPPAPPARPFESELLREPMPAPAPARPPLAAAPEKPAPAAPPKGARPASTAAPPKPPAKAAPASPQVGLPAWVVQVGSFSSLENARKLVRKLRKAGFQTLDPEPVELRGKRLYRVRVGPVLEKAAAEKLLPRVDKVTGTHGKVRPYP